MARQRPDLADLYQLADQLERDRDVPLHALKERDHDLAAGLDAGQRTDEAALLLAWLDRVAEPGSPRRLEATAMLALSRVVAALLGFAAMAGFLLGSARGLVNVLLLLGVFVLLQLVMSLASGIALLRTVSGHRPQSLPASPAHWLMRRSLPDRRALREASGVLRLLYLRFGQEWGALFTLGALVAFVLVPGISEFSFVWGSTFPIGSEVMQSVTRWLATPWSAVLPWASVAPEVVSSSRFHPALVNLDRSGIESMRGWWGFLFLCLLVYALLPRLCLWLGARWYYPRLLASHFVHYPGADLVLRRMRGPLVSTQAATAGPGPGATGAAGMEDGIQPAALDGRLLLLDWSDAMGTEPPAAFEELLAVAADNVVAAGRGELGQDQQRIRERAGAGFDQLLVVVKSWEPPMAELADLLEELAEIRRCTIYLLPLPGKAVPHRKVEDWRGFARELPFDAVDVRLLNRVAAV